MVVVVVLALPPSLLSPLLTNPEKQSFPREHEPQHTASTTSIRAAAAGDGKLANAEERCGEMRVLGAAAAGGRSRR
uniref:Secreted protein n=1 Tax=Oryza punctata TaxID=4537 RepID=A0A0E0KPX8_ORYPU